MGTVYAANLESAGAYNPGADTEEMTLGETWDTGWATLVDAVNDEQWEEAAAEDLAEIRLVTGGGTIYRDGGGGFFAAWEED